ncbi:hypothetical protein D3C80_1607800 [compost metagenome]
MSAEEFISRTVSFAFSSRFVSTYNAYICYKLLVQVNVGAKSCTQEFNCCFFTVIVQHIP